MALAQRKDLSLPPIPIGGREYLTDSHRVSITLMPDGSPHTVPVWVGVENNRIAILTAPAQKYLGAPYPLRDDRVVFLVEPEHAWARSYA